MNVNTDQINIYENGEMKQKEEIAFFQDLINTGQAWHLEGSYGRQAKALIDAGLCMLGEKGHRDAYGNYVPSRHEVKPGTPGSKEYCEQKAKEQSE